MMHFNTFLTFSFIHPYKNGRVWCFNWFEYRKRGIQLVQLKKQCFRIVIVERIRIRHLRWHYRCKKSRKWKTVHNSFIISSREALWPIRNRLNLVKSTKKIKYKTKKKKKKKKSKKRKRKNNLRGLRPKSKTSKTPLLLMNTKNLKPKKIAENRSGNQNHRFWV